MINSAKCQTCYPIVAKIIEIKFEGEKEPRQCIVRAWKACSEIATEHIVDYVDPNKLGTMFILHRCIAHAKPQEKMEAPQTND